MVTFRLTLLVICGATLAMPVTGFGQLSPADIKSLQERGRAEGWTFTIAENEASRRPLRELCGAVEPPNWRDRAVFDNRPARGSLPPAFDWRDFDGCTPVRNQAGCGSCWAFGAVGTVESMLLLNESISVDLSEQWLVSCTDAGSCGGGWHTVAYDCMKLGGLPDYCGDSGVVLEEDCPYAADDVPCSCPYAHPHSIFSWAVVGPERDTPSVAQIKQAILDHGPVSTAIHAGGAFGGYVDGVFNACQDGVVNHIVDLVGWDDSLGTEGVWILRNSWGEDWGMDGYMLIEYGCNRVGYATCYVNYAAQDCNGNGVSDRCDISCETPGGLCDVPGCGQSPDCNGNRVPDECDLSSGMSTDYNSNGLPDDCEQDCDRNGVPDECDLSCAGGCAGAPWCGETSDCQPDGMPDVCQIAGVHLEEPAPGCDHDANGGDPWCEDFESYPLGTLDALYWEGWAGDPSAIGTVTDEQNHTPGGYQSFKIESHDTVRLFYDYFSWNTPHWLLRAHVYVPSTMTGTAFFIVNPDYYVGIVGTTWSVILSMNTQEGTVESDYGPEHLSLITDAWAEIRCEINFDLDVVTIYYDGAFLTSYPWSIGDGWPNIAAVDLFSSDSSGFYYDDLSLFPAVSNDTDGNGWPDDCDCVGPSVARPDPSPVPSDLGHGTKNRYVSFVAGDPGRQTAVRVHFESLPGFAYAEGRRMWVQAPYPVTEASGSNGPAPPYFWAAELGCSPFYTDWTVYDRVDVFDAAFVPGAILHVETFDESCGPTKSNRAPLVLEVELSAAGDVVGDCGATPCTAPQGVVDFMDISALVEKFKNTPTAPRKARSDIVHSNIAQPAPDLKVDFVDISYCVEAFRGQASLLPGPPVTDPCQ